MRDFNKIVGVVFLAFLLGGGQPAGAETRPQVEPRELHILNWFGDYVPPELIREFENRFQAKVYETRFFSEAERHQQLMAMLPGEEFDLVMASFSELEAYKELEWASPLDKSKLPNLKHIAPRWLWHKNGELYAMPYTWGTLGIGYREDLIKEDINSWQQILEPNPKWEKRLIFTDSAEDIFSAALKTLGYSINTHEIAEVDEAAALLLAMKSSIMDCRNYVPDEQHPLVTGEVWITQFYSLDGLLVTALHPKIRFVTPKEGTILWSDQWVLLPQAREPELALAFMNFLQSPENAAKIAETLSVATGNLAARELLPESHLNNLGIYPSKDVIGKSEFRQKEKLYPIKLKMKKVYDKLMNCR